MLSGLPDRPLFDDEVAVLADSEAITFAFPATPNSMRTDEEGQSRVYDLVLILDETTVGIVYDEDEGWHSLIQTDAERPNETAIAAITEYRDYDIAKEEAVRQVAELIGLVSGMIEEM